jgi:spore maturation protein CgeB
MKFLYIGYDWEGSTSKMRGQEIRKLLNIPPAQFRVVDMGVPQAATSRLMKSLAWRFKTGPMIGRTNRHILDSMDGEYDWIWVDRGVFLRPETIQHLRKLTPKLIWYTPDPAFTFHRSRFFFRSISLYDFCVTTKLFEIEDYHKAGAKEVIYVTQGYDPAMHKPYVDFEKKSGVVFLGHHETGREKDIQALLEAGIEVKLAGFHWDKFAKQAAGSFPNLKYLGPGVYAEAYARTISGSLIGLGFLSKWIPELHTTRTFEIPACGTALATEANQETTSFFGENEAIFYKSTAELVEKIRFFLDHPEKLKAISEAGYKTVTEGGFDYTSLMRGVLEKIADHE